MADIFLVSDTHFGHAGVCKFLCDDGSKLRPWTDPTEMDEEMVKRWNETVRPTSTVISTLIK
jgi:calcineurin-like phosphoesterase family protein